MVWTLTKGIGRFETYKYSHDHPGRSIIKGVFRERQALEDFVIREYIHTLKLPFYHIYIMASCYRNPTKAALSALRLYHR